jgi:DNA-binding GntR family transcriptional regulator
VAAPSRIQPTRTAAGVDSLDQRRAIRHDVVHRLLAEMFGGRLAAGSRLITQALSKRLGISATPLREALVELEAIGMVEISHNRGAVAAPFGPTQLREIYQVRRVLESEAARCACGRIDRGELLSLRKEIQELAERSPKAAAWLRGVLAADARLHGMIAAACGSPRLAREVGRYALLMQTIGETIGNRHRGQENGLEEHAGIVDALIAGDAEASGLAMGRHIDAAAERAIKAMFVT